MTELWIGIGAFSVGVTAEVWTVVLPVVGVIASGSLTFLLMRVRNAQAALVVAHLTDEHEMQRRSQENEAASQRIEIQSHEIELSRHRIETLEQLNHDLSGELDRMKIALVIEQQTNSWLREMYQRLYEHYAALNARLVIRSGGARPLVNNRHP